MQGVRGGAKMNQKQVNQCKVCGEDTKNGTNFCSRKHRLEWVRKHNYTRNDWRRIARRNERVLIKMSGGVDLGDVVETISERRCYER